MMQTLRLARKLLGNRNLILILAFVLGLLIGPLPWLADLTLPALAMVMTAAATQVPSSVLTPPRRLLRPTLLAMACTYAVAGTVTLVVARLLLADPLLWAGYVLVAVAPPGVAVVPFSAILGGDSGLALLGMTGSYLAALLLTPLLAGLLVGSELVQPLRLLLILVELVLIPLVLSRLLRLPRLQPYADRWRSVGVNWGFFVVILTVVALNRGVFLQQPGVLLRTTAVAMIGVFGLGFLSEWVLPQLGLPRREVISLTLFTAVKNSGFAAATALALLGDEASVPGAVVSVVLVLYLIVLGLRADRRAQE